MNILLIGSGGREHALAWKIAQSPLCDKLYTAPGNPGTASCGENVDIGVNQFEKLGEFVLAQRIKMMVVGPEDPMVNGISDYFQATPDHSDLIVIGPSKAGAMLEGSKDFAKAFMAKHQIPTASYKTFEDSNFEQGIQYIRNSKPPIVLKADGLAAGKGVIISQSSQEAEAAFTGMIKDAKFGTAGAKVVIEQFLTGIEYSVFILTDGKDYKLLPVAKDYKRIGEKDTGLNTGGMGAISPPPFVDEALMNKTIKQIVEPTLKGLQADGIHYTGFLYFGLINVEGDPYVIEYNVRLGDPETEVVMLRIKSDLVEAMTACGEGNLSSIELELDDRAACTVMLVSGGYPESYEKGKLISGLDDVQDSIVFHSGTKEENGQIVTSGGRVLAITAYGASLDDALENAYRSAEKIDFDGIQYRKHIGFDFVSQQSDKNELYSIKNRNRYSWAHHGESTYHFLDDSAWSIASYVRELTHGWASQFLDDTEFHNRYKSSKNSQHLAALFELVVSTILSNQNFEVEHHKVFVNSTRKPDFFLSKNNSKFVVECVMSGDPHYEETESMQNRIKNLLESIESKKAFVNISFIDCPKTTPSFRYLRKAIENAIKFQENKIIESNGWKFELTYFPKSKETSRTIGFQSSYAGKMIDSTKYLKQSLDAKRGSKYGTMDFPYVIAVFSRDMSLDNIDIIETLYGRFTNESQIDISKSKDNAYFITNGKPVNQSVSAVWLFRHLGNFNLTGFTTELWHNPWAKFPLDKRLIHSLHIQFKLDESGTYTKVESSTQIDQAKALGIDKTKYEQLKQEVWNNPLATNSAPS